MKRQRLFCRCAAVVAQVVVDKETHLQLSMTAIDGGEGQLWVIRVGLPMHRSLPVFPHEQTSAASVGMSQKCQKRKSGLLRIDRAADHWTRGSLIRNDAPP
jgi:hypothetical protein